MKDEARLGAGDVEFLLGDERVVLRPTLRAAQYLSRQHGGLSHVMDQIVALDVNTMVSVVSSGANMDGAKAADLPDRVWKAGLPQLAAPLVRYVSVLANGGRPPQEAEAHQDSDDPPNT